jgi:RNA polymerase sigma-70 factor (ECF subfamily)
MPSFQRERSDGSFRGWLRTITRNKIGDHIRSTRDRPAQFLSPSHGGNFYRNHRLPRPLEWHEEEPRFEELQTEKHILFHRILELIQTEFTPPTWKAFLRLVVDNVPPKEVASELGLSLNAIYLAKSRVLRRIRDEFGREIPE